MMDDTVLLFRVLEEPSLQYLGIVRNADREWGLFSATIKREDVEEIKKELLKD
jgi:superfamily II DNA/RNA helicase